MCKTEVFMLNVPNIQLLEMQLMCENFEIENAVRMVFVLKCT
jgi:hypothetical protein